MKVGIIGLPLSGKTSVFNAVSGGSAQVGSFSQAANKEPNLAVVSVPDWRHKWLSELYKPKKTTPATVELVDVAGVLPGQAKNEGFSAQLLQSLRQVDALVHVVRAFDDPTVPHPQGAVDPLRDAELLELELILADLSVVDKRLEKIDQDIQRKKGQERAQIEAEKELLGRFRADLTAEKPLRNYELKPDDEKLIRGYTFLSQKPLLIACNISESDIGKDKIDSLSSLSKWADERAIPVLTLSAKTEMEIAQLDPSERQEFLSALAIEESGRDKLIKAAYRLLRLVAFFTVGEDEVKAWTITKGTPAQEAARKIHSDIARGFIRAEVIPYDSIHEYGTWNHAKDKGQLRLEGKEYLVQDGDCINFRFNV
ncbi:MAG TPA: redox-regulated ATPase YchF [Candidatus Obscuribacterales bacterium]